MSKAAALPAAAGLEEPLTGLVRWMTRRDVQEQVLRQAACPVPVSHTWLLGRIEACGPCHPSRLAEMVGLDNSTITAKLKRLEAEGLVQRETDPEDRRAALLAVTASGARLLQRLRQARARIVWVQLQELSPERRSSVVSALSDLAAVLDDSGGRSPGPGSGWRPGGRPVDPTRRPA